MKCPKCGKENTTKFCTECGTLIVNESTQPKQLFSSQSIESYLNNQEKKPITPMAVPYPTQKQTAQNSDLHQKNGYNQNTYNPNAYNPNAYSQSNTYNQNSFNMNNNNQYNNVSNQDKGKYSVMALVSMILGIVSVVTIFISFLSWFGILCAIVGIILGFIARKDKDSSVKGKATAGIILSIIKIVVTIIMFIIAAVAVNSLINDITDSANASSANEYTNAIERFTSEYELYSNAVSNGYIDFNDMDSSEERVYQVTMATNANAIKQIESYGMSDIKLNPDTKYPANDVTAVRVFEEYTRSNIPESDNMHYYYCPQEGIVVCAKPKQVTYSDDSILDNQVLNPKTSGDWDWYDLTEYMKTYTAQTPY